MPHHEYYGFFGVNSYNVAYPNTYYGITRQDKVQRLRTHGYNMAGQTVPSHGDASIPVITSNLNINQLYWRGATLGDEYTIERSTAGPSGPWTVISNWGATDIVYPYVDSGRNTAQDVWYRIKARNIAGVEGSYSSVFHSLAAGTPTPTLAGTNIAPSAMLSVDSTNSSYTKDKAMDGNKTDPLSRWISANTAEPNWFQLDWASDKVINIVKVLSGSMAGVGWQIDDYEIQYWNGSVWQTVVSVVSNTQDGYYGQYNNLTFTAVTTNKLRMYITDGTTQAGYTNARLLEIEVWGH